MRLTNISFQNMRRRKTRSALLVLSLIIGVASIVFLYTTNEAMKEDVANKLDQYGSNILILPETGEAMSFGGITVEAPTQVPDLGMSVIPLMKTIKNKETLATIAPKLLQNAQINGKEVLILGVDFQQELKLKKWWKIDGLAKSQTLGSNDILLGSDIASSLGLTENQALTIKGQSFNVAGIIQPTGSSENDQSVFMDLSTTQQLWNRPGALSLIETAALCYTCPIDQVTQQLQEKLPGTKVTALKSSLQSRNDTVGKFKAFALTVSLIILLASVLVVTMTMMASVKERTREIGILRSIGFRKSHIIQVILTEVGGLSILGGLLGFLLGMGAAVRYGPALSKTQIHMTWQPVLSLYAVGGALFVGLIATVYPAWKAAKLDPVDALRYL
ncbi:ABC transporter permease [Paradesulfitobacterium aromaticivorans]